jgi:MFS family permease
VTLNCPLNPSTENAPADEVSLPHAGYKAVLGNRTFLALWLGQVFSQLGDRIVFVAFVAVITQVYGASDRYTSFLYVAFTIPAILLTAIAGVFVDRWPRRAVLVGTNLIRAGLVALLPLAGHHSLEAMYALAFGISAATQFFVPAESATIPAIMPKSQLLTANSLFTTTMMGSVVFGFALGDPLISKFSLEYIHIPLTALFLLASAALWLVNIPPTPSLLTPEGGATVTEINQGQPRSVRASVAQFMQEIKEGVATIVADRMMARAMFRLSVLFSAIVALCVLFISFAKAFLYADPNVAARKFTYIITSSGIGMVLGAGMVGRFLAGVPRGWLVEGGLTAIGLGLVFLANIGLVLPVEYAPITWLHNTLHLTWTPRVLVTYLVTGGMGMAAACVAIPLQALIQELIPEDKRGKVMGVQFTLLSTASTLPVLLAGIGTEHFGVQSIMGGLGALLLVLGLKGLVQRYGYQKTLDTVDTHW